jgi:phospho-N-acetylmuramoyl-pentapeptide-transferase
MLVLLAKWMAPWFGPARLLNSYLVLIGLGTFMSAVLTWILLEKRAFFRLVPQDRGKLLVESGHISKGKPTGVGLLLMLFTLPVLLVLMPPSIKAWEVIACLVIAMGTGFLDDSAHLPWGEFKKGMLDVFICVACSVALCQFEPVRMWLPFVKGDFLVSPWLYIPVSSAVLWVMINATNCTDGVDGLAGSLSLLSLLYLGGFLYGVVGHKAISGYLLVTHNPEGAMWALLVFVFVGTLTAYLWFNAEPSQMLMGDAGSRPLGLLLGVAVMASGNPFLIVVASPIILVNGGTGLVKLALLRFVKRLGFETAADTASPPVRLLHKVRFPLHDHCRKHLKWSNAQVLMRFSLLQALLVPLLLVLLIKLR